VVRGSRELCIASVLVRQWWVLHGFIWGWVNTYRYSLLGDEHPFATYFDVHQGYMVLTHSHILWIWGFFKRRKFPWKTWDPMGSKTRNKMWDMFPHVGVMLCLMIFPKIWMEWGRTHRCGPKIHMLGGHWSPMVWKNGETWGYSRHLAVTWAMKKKKLLGKVGEKRTSWFTDDSYPLVN